MQLHAASPRRERRGHILGNHADEEQIAAEQFTESAPEQSAAIGPAAAIATAAARCRPRSAAPSEIRKDCCKHARRATAPKRAVQTVRARQPEELERLRDQLRGSARHRRVARSSAAADASSSSASTRTAAQQQCCREEFGDGVAAVPCRTRRNHIDARRAVTPQTQQQRSADRRTAGPAERSNNAPAIRRCRTGEQRKSQHFAAEPGSAPHLQRAPRMDRPPEMQGRQRPD